MRNNSENPRYFIQSLGKGLSLLQIMAEKGVPLTLSEIAKAMDTNKAAITRFCFTLQELGFIRRDNQKLYHLTPTILSLGYPVICNMDWRLIAEYYLQRFFDDVQETVNLSILDGPDIQYVIRIRREKYLPFDVSVGTKLPVYCTSMGKVLLALGSPEKTRPILESLVFKPIAQKTITSMDKFLEDLETVRARGYGVNDGELTEGNSALAAPILNKTGYAVAAINVAAPATRYSRMEMEEKLLSQLIVVAQEISKSLMQVESPIVTESE